MTRALLCIGLAALLAACSGVRVTDYAGRQPELRLEEFFSGDLTAHGVVKNRAGLVTRTFNADIAASWSGATGTLVEDFLFDDGEEQRRVWTLTRQGDNRYTGTAGDVVGSGELQVAGNSLFLEYTLRVPWRDGSIDVQVDDRMYLVSPNVLINESRLTKFGFDVGELVLVIVRHPG